MFECSRQPTAVLRVCADQPSQSHKPRPIYTPQTHHCFEGVCMAVRPIYTHQTHHCFEGVCRLTLTNTRKPDPHTKHTAALRACANHPSQTNSKQDLNTKNTAALKKCGNRLSQTNSKRDLHSKSPAALRVRAPGVDLVYRRLW